MTATATDLVPGHRRGSWLWNRQLEHYPDTGLRMLYLGITVLATVMLYYELYVGGSVATLLLANLRMTFSFYVVILAFGNLLGAFGSLFAGLADRWGRANLVVGGLLVTAVFVGFIMPAATNKWVFGIETFAVAIIEGICLVATPALIRDFSPQVGRATAMGFWTSGPVLGGGATGLKILGTINANKAAINGVIAVGPQLATVVPFAAQLTALSKVPPGVFAYLKAHGTAVQNAAAQSPGQWRTWYWICFAGVIFFLLSIPILRGRWKPSDARRDEQEHEAMVEAELAKLNA